MISKLIIRKQMKIRTRRWGGGEVSPIVMKVFLFILNYYLSTKKEVGSWGLFFLLFLLLGATGIQLTSRFPVRFLFLLRTPYKYIITKLRKEGQDPIEKKTPPENGKIQIRSLPIWSLSLYPLSTAKGSVSSCKKKKKKMYLYLVKVGRSCRNSPFGVV